MKARKLPTEIRHAINTRAHALAQVAYAEHRGRLEAEAWRLLQVGAPLPRVLEHFGAGVPTDRQPQLKAA